MARPSRPPRTDCSCSRTKLGDPTRIVRPEARRRGHLRNLLIAAYGWARRLELTEVRLYTSADAVIANALAEEFGFTAFEVVRRKAIDWCLPPEQQI